MLSDTHLRPGLDRDLPPEVWAAAGEADLILHAGDVLTVDLLDRLADHAPVHAVLGNNDVTLRRELPETRQVELDGLKVAMIHDSGPRAGRASRMRRRFPDADVVVYGHSHLPDDSEEDGQRLFNPGSCTERRRAPYRTFGWWEVRGGQLAEHRIVELR